MSEYIVNENSDFVDALVDGILNVNVNDTNYTVDVREHPKGWLYVHSVTPAPTKRHWQMMSGAFLFDVDVELSIPHVFQKEA